MKAMKKAKSTWIKLTALCLVIILAFPITANAAEESTLMPYASYYLDSYNTYMYAAGSGKVQVWFSVTGTSYMDEIGSLSIMLYESTDNTTWTRVKTFLHEDYSSMLTSNKVSYSSCVTYQGVAGRYYKAYVCLWAGKNSGGDTRYMWATSVKAT